MIEQYRGTLLREVCGLKRKNITVWNIKDATPTWESVR